MIHLKRHYHSSQNLLSLTLNVLLTLIVSSLIPTTTLAAEPEIVPTFNSLGITWKPNGASVDETAAVRYRMADTSAWNEGLPLWFDPEVNEYRGSIVHLKPNTNYEIELTLDGTSTTSLTQAQTWSENFPIAKTVTLPEFSSKQLIIKESGTPQGYILYTHRSGQTATIDVDNEYEGSIRIEGSYIIVRGLTLKGGQEYGVQIINNAHDIIIENNDISNWGKIAPDGWAEGTWGGVDVPGDSTSDRLIIQGNTIHHPRSDANNWDEPRPFYNNNPHPRGPHGIRFQSSGTNHVIRYNDIFTDDEHYFKDCIGGGNFPNADSDIYGNFIERCWDDGIEAEGVDRNVRIWGNYFNRSYVGIGVAPV